MEKLEWKIWFDLKLRQFDCSSFLKIYMKVMFRKFGPETYLGHVQYQPFEGGKLFNVIGLSGLPPEGVTDLLYGH